MGNSAFILLCISTVFLLMMGAYIASIKQKVQLHYAFLLTILFMSFYNIACILEKLFISNYNYHGLVFARLAYLGFSFFPVAFLFVSQIFTHSTIRIKQIILWIMIPIMTNIVLLFQTNMFFMQYNGLDQFNKYGFYNDIHVLYSYFCFFIAFVYLINFFIKKSGIFSKQAFLIFLGTIVPILLNVQFTISEKYQERFLLQGIDILYSPYITPITFSFAILCYAIAIIRYDFLNIIPIATEKVVNQISDLFVVIDSKYRIISYNEPFETVFSQILSFKRKDNIIELIRSNPILNINAESLKLIINESKFKDITVKREKHLQTEDIDKWYIIEISVIDKKKDLGTIILFKDVTEQRLDQQRLKEQEKLSVLGQLTSSIAHSFKTPLLSIFGYTDGIQEDTATVRQILNKNSLTDSMPEVKEKLDIIENQTNLIIKYIKNMEDIIMTVMSHFESTQLIGQDISFTINELLEDILRLGYQCSFEVTTQDNYLINGGNKLVLIQVIDTIINNSIYAYNERRMEAVIKINILKKDNNIVFTLEDNAGGIPRNIAEKIFEEINTTKGTKGTGLGLILARGLLRACFRGSDISFNTEEGKGTSWNITFPNYK